MTKPAKFNILEEKWDRKVLLSALLAPIILAAVYFLALNWAHTERTDDLGVHSAYEKRALFGDSFGALNALFAGSAFAFLLVAIREQKKEIRLQRDEIELQKIALTAYKDEVKGQNAHSQLERFETKFFKLLDDLRNLQNPAVQSIAHIQEERNHPLVKVNERIAAKDFPGAKDHHKEWSEMMRSGGDFESYVSWMILTFQFLVSSSKEPPFSNLKDTERTDLEFYFNLLSASLSKSMQG